jgi:hypothetical protein
VSSVTDAALKKLVSVGDRLVAINGAWPRALGGMRPGYDGSRRCALAPRDGCGGNRDAGPGSLGPGRERPSARLLLAALCGDRT